MRLKGFQVKKFRSIEDSGWIETEDVTALIGTNESGKTNVLLPLWKLNPVEGGKINLIDDLPREEYSVLRNASPKPIFISAKYELSDSEQKQLLELSENNHEQSEFREVLIKKDYDNNLFFEFPDEKLPNIEEIINIVKEQLDNVKDSIENLAKRSEINNSEKERTNQYLGVIKKAINILPTLPHENNVENLKDIIESADISVKSSKSAKIFEDAKHKVLEKLQELHAPRIADSKAVIEQIKIQMPKYIYYSNYGNLDSQIYLSRVVTELNRKDLTQKEAAKVRTLKTLFDLVELNPEEISNLGTETQSVISDENVINETAKRKEERDILLSSAATKFTKAFNEWWKQGNYNFEFRADGGYFQILVSDSARPERLPLEARSTGLQWFFSFYLVFLVESKQKHQNAILLLDEPGVTLHPLAQADLFRFFEGLSEENQLLYTTHSPFMVDSNHLERVRSVYIDDRGKTVVSSDLRASEKKKGKNQIQSIYPVNAALGLSVSQTLLVNCQAVLVEGESDQLYLSAIKNLLISKQKIAPLKEIVFIPTGGTKGIRATASIIGGVKEDLPPVIVDGDTPGMKIKKELLDELYAACQDRIISISDFSKVEKGEIEDLFPKRKMQLAASKFLRHEYQCDEDFEDANLSDEPICNQIEKFSRDNEFQLEKGWKVKLAASVKSEILKGNNKIFAEEDTELAKFIDIFKKIISFSK